MRIGPLKIARVACVLLKPRRPWPENECEGYELLATPRPEASCSTILAKIHPPPDKKLHAVVLPAETSLNATPDMESQVVIRSIAGDTLNSFNHSSPRCMNGYCVDTAQWSPDSQFFIWSLISAGGQTGRRSIPSGLRTAS